MNSQLRLRYGLALVFALAGCFDIHADRRTLEDTPFTLGPAGRTLRPNKPLRAIGPYNELCLELPEEYRLGTDTGPDAWNVGRPDGKFVAPRVTMIAPDGRREDYPVAGFRLGSGRAICFETNPPRDPSRRYVAVELRADDTLRIVRVRWSAGHRYASL